MKTNKRASSGLSVLVFVITILIIAGIASMMIATITSGLRMTTINTFKRGVEEYSAYLKPEIIFATDGRNRTLNTFYIKAKLAPSSGEIALNDTIIEFDTFNTSVDLRYGTGPCIQDTTFNSSGLIGFWSNGTAGRGYYTVQYLKNSSNHRDMFVAQGELVKICMNSPRGITEWDNIHIAIVPNKGNPWIYEVEMKPFSERQAQIFP